MYEMMVPPFERVDFEEMTSKQAKQYFEWYTGQIDNRIALLLNEMHIDGIDYAFNYSIDSLKPMWKWLEAKLEMRMLGEDEYQSNVSKYPEWMKEYIPKKEFTYETLMYVMDVAMYFAEVVVKQNEKVEWGCFRSGEYKNQPVLTGFKNGRLNPRQVVLNCARRSEREKDPARLYNMYYTWMKYL